MNSAHPTTTNRIFIGPLGLRAGWSLLLYLGIAATFITSVNVVHHHIRVAHQQAAHRLHPDAPIATPVKVDPAAPQPLLEQNIIEVSLFTFLSLVAWLMATLERRRLAVFGLAGRHPLRRFLTGAFWGLAALSLLILTLHTFHLLTFDARLLHGPAIVFWAAAQLVTFFMVALVEEFFFRGYLQFTLTRGMVALGNVISRPHAQTIGFWIAACFTSAFFFIAHIGNGGETKLGLLQIFLASLMFILALWRTGSLWWAIGFHMTWDWSQCFLYGVPDSGSIMQGRLFATHPNGNPLFSGGTVGPEGSVLIIPLLLLVLLVLLLTRRSPQPSLDQLPPPRPREGLIKPLVVVIWLFSGRNCAFFP